MRPFIDLTGHTYARLTVLSQAPRKKGRIVWQCQCSCGVIVVVAGGNLRSGTTRSCGCYQKERVSTSNRRHGKSRTTEYNIWCGMIQRCSDPRHEAFKNYGGRGITVCAAWRESFEQFLADMGPRPTLKHTLDRKENNGPYSKENCRWTTRMMQANNKRGNKFLLYQGRKQTINLWAHEFHLQPATLWARLFIYKWSIERALTSPVRIWNR
jgi:hypothetical protein